VAVCLYELVRGRKATAPKAAGKKKTSPSSGSVERLTQVLLGVLNTSGYIKPRAVAADEKLRRLVRRMELNANDAEVLLGMMRQIAWKLNVDDASEKNDE
jgi:tRNA C32,U32 (ribose-2'-O)-methylase TrmJ